MKTQAHTPGPWRTDHEGELRGGPNDEPLTKIYRAHYGDDCEESAGFPNPADACLIAAAPDMLAALTETALALERATAYIDGLNPIERDTDCALTAARAVIAKATGVP